MKEITQVQSEKKIPSNSQSFSQSWRSKGSQREKRTESFISGADVEIKHYCVSHKKINVSFNESLSYKNREGRKNTGKIHRVWFSVSLVIIPQVGFNSLQLFSEPLLRSLCSRSC